MMERGEVKASRTGTVSEFSVSIEIEIRFGSLLDSSENSVASDRDSRERGDILGEPDFFRFLKKLGEDPLEPGGEYPSVFEPLGALSLFLGVLGRTKATSSSESEDEIPFEKFKSSVVCTPSLLPVRILFSLSPEEEEEDFFLGGSGREVGISEG